MKAKSVVLATLLCVVAATASITVGAAAGWDEVKRVGAATTVLNELTRAHDKSIPASILEKAEAIAIFPGVKKAGFVVGGQWGRGVISVRDAGTRKWSSPAFLTLTGGSLGAQIGGTEIDVILVIMNRTGVEHLLSNQVKLGGEISAAAGPLGRAGEASTDLQMQAQILSYSRSRGLFAGVTVNGSVIKEDMDVNTRFYEKALSSEDIVSQPIEQTLHGVPSILLGERFSCGLLVNLLFL
jgi:lipid-binding SYLF domain-containing protein